jgi:hypothetical protein
MAHLERVACYPSQELGGFAKCVQGPYQLQKPKDTMWLIPPLINP